MFGLLVETLFNIGHAFKVGGDVGAVLRGVLDLVLGGQVVQRIDGRVETGNSQEGSQAFNFCKIRN